MAENVEIGVTPETATTVGRSPEVDERYEQ